MMSTFFPDGAGATAVTEVPSGLTASVRDRLAPKRTSVTSLKLVPEMVTDVPAPPELGLMLVTFGP